MWAGNVPVLEGSYLYHSKLERCLENCIAYADMKVKGKGEVIPVL
jgi:hypothetical protein